MKTVRAIYSAMDALSKWVSRICVHLAALFIALCAAALLFQVIYRFIIVKFVSFSFPFTEEFARYALIWASYLCIGVCLREGSHAVVNMVFDKLPPKLRFALYCLTRVIMFVFLFVAVKYGFQVLETSKLFKSTTLRIPGVFLFSAPVAGCLWMLYETVTEWLGVICGELEPFYAGEKRKAGDF